MKKRLLYACHHSCLDPSNGAAITAREILKALAEKSWDVRVLCGPAVDDDGHVLQLLADNGITRTKTVVNTGAIPFSLVHYRDGNIPSTVFLPGDDFPSRDASDVFFRLSRRLLEDFHCDILLSYGGHGVGPRLFKAARKKRVATQETTGWTGDGTTWGGGEHQKISELLQW